MEMALHVLCVLLIIFQVVYCDEKNKNDGLIDRINNGMKFATDFLGSESVALKVAEFVVRAFQTGNNNAQATNRWRPQNDLHIEEPSETAHEESNFSTENKDHDINETESPLTPLRHLVRLFGLQPSQISAVAVNALVFVAQLISSFFVGPKRQIRPFRSDDPLSWIRNKNSRRLQDLLNEAKNESLPHAIDELIQLQGTAEETSCIQLLVCKITPFISRMQKTVFANDEVNDEKSAEELRGSAAMYRHLPTATEINARSDICEQKHKDCNLNE